MAIPPTTRGWRRGLLAVYQALVPRSLRPRTRAEALVIRHSAGRIVAGPFAGMRYFAQPTGDAWSNRVLGAYEKEIHPWLESLRSQAIDHVVNVGAADGYYAVALATIYPEARVDAFETLVEKHPVIRSLAEMNGVSDRVDVRGAADTEELSAVVGRSSNTLVMMDIEGFEMELADPSRVPALRHSTLLIEVHDELRPGVAEMLRARFRDSHDLKVVRQQPRTVDDLSIRSRIYDRWLLALIREDRPTKQEYFLFVPRR